MTDIRTLFLFFASTFTMLGATPITSQADTMKTSIENTENCPAFLNQNYRKLHSSEEVNLCSLVKGDALVIVNTASHCGYTPQFKELEALHKQYSDAGLTTIGFASNDFNQETKEEAESASICFKNFGVTFTMLAPTPIKGEAANPTFKYINEMSESPSWNFNKYIIDLKSGEVKHFGSRTQPLNSEFEAEVARLVSPDTRS